MFPDTRLGVYSPVAERGSRSRTRGPAMQSLREILGAEAPASLDLGGKEDAHSRGAQTCAAFLTYLIMISALFMMIAFVVAAAIKYTNDDASGITTALYLHITYYLGDTLEFSREYKAAWVIVASITFCFVLELIIFISNRYWECQNPAPVPNSYWSPWEFIKTTVLALIAGFFVPNAVHITDVMTLVVLSVIMGFSHIFASLVQYAAQLSPAVNIRNYTIATMLMGSFQGNETNAALAAEKRIEDQIRYVNSSNKPMDEKVREMTRLDQARQHVRETVQGISDHMNLVKDQAQSGVNLGGAGLYFSLSAFCYLVWSMVTVWGLAHTWGGLTMAQRALVPLYMIIACTWTISSAIIYLVGRNGKPVGYQGIKIASGIFTASHLFLNILLWWSMRDKGTYGAL